MEVKRLKLSQIKPNPDNPRIIRDEKFKKLEQSEGYLGLARSGIA